MHPVYGIPVLIVVLYGLYELLAFWVGVLVDFVQNVIFGHYINPMATKVVETLIPCLSYRNCWSGSTTRYGCPDLMHSHNPAHHCHVFHRVRNPRGQRLPTAARDHEQQGLQHDRTERQGCASHVLGLGWGPWR